MISILKKKSRRTSRDKLSVVDRLALHDSEHGNKTKNKNFSISLDSKLVVEEFLDVGRRSHSYSSREKVVKPRRSDLKDRKHTLVYKQYLYDGEFNSFNYVDSNSIIDVKFFHQPPSCFKNPPRFKDGQGRIADFQTATDMWSTCLMRQAVQNMPRDIIRAFSSGSRYSVLNGSHGESTDEDDHPNPLQKAKQYMNDEHKRRNREAATQRIHARKSDNRGKDGKNNTNENNFNKLVEQNIDEQVQEEDEIKSSSKSIPISYIEPPESMFAGHDWEKCSIIYVSIVNEFNVVFNGTSFEQYNLMSIGTYGYFHDKKIYILPNQPYLMRCSPLSYGLYELKFCFDSRSIKGSEIMLQSAFVYTDYVKDQGCNPRGMDNVLIFKPFLTELRTAFPNASPLTEHSIAACKAYGVRSSHMKCDMPYNIITNTIMAYLYTQELVYQKYTNSKLLGQDKPVFLDALEKSTITRLNVTADYCGPFILEGQSCVLNDDYINRDDYSIDSRKSRGFYTIDAQGVRMEEGCYFRFETLYNQKPKYYRTAMCQIAASGDDAPEFMLYDINGINACKALKRMFGTYEGNSIYRFFQYNLSDVLAGAPTLSRDFTQRLLRIMRVQTPAESRLPEPSYRVGSNEHNHIVPHYQFVWSCGLFARADMGLFAPVCQLAGEDWYTTFTKVRSNIQDLYSRLKARCTRSILDSIIDSYSGAKNWLYYSVYEKYLTYLDMYDSRQACTEIPHIKRQLRRTFFKGVAVHDDLDVLVTKLDAIVKKEFAKLGKVPRLFVSYGAGGIYASELPEFVKVCIHGEYRLYGDRVNTTIYIMSKNRSGDLDDMFRRAHQLVNTKGECMIVIYSDDSLMVANIDDELHMKNLDISSCDSSNRFPIFQAVAGLLEGFAPDRALGLVRQCCLPMELRNSSNPAESIAFNFDGPFEGSGTLLTTICNHLASTFIATAIHTVINSTTKPVDECIRLGALFVGHKMTVQNCEHFENLQFLKRSPVKCTLRGHEDWFATLNYGTIFRGFGTLEGDIAAEMIGVSNNDLQRMPWPERMDRFLSVVVQGLKTEPSSRIMDALEQRFAVTPSVSTDMMGAIANQHYMNVDKVDRLERPKVVESSLMTRYSMEEYEITELCEVISRLRVGLCCSSPACTKFFSCDY